MGALSAVRRVAQVTPFSRGLRLCIFAVCLTAFLVLVSGLTACWWSWVADILQLGWRTFPTVGVGVLCSTVRVWCGFCDYHLGNGEQLSCIRDVVAADELRNP